MVAMGSLPGLINNPVSSGAPFVPTWRSGQGKSWFSNDQYGSSAPTSNFAVHQGYSKPYEGYTVPTLTSAGMGEDFWGDLGIGKRQLALQYGLMGNLDPSFQSNSMGAGPSTETRAALGAAGSMQGEKDLLAGIDASQAALNNQQYTRPTFSNFSSQAGQLGLAANDYATAMQNAGGGVAEQNLMQKIANLKGMNPQTAVDWYNYQRYLDDITALAASTDAVLKANAASAGVGNPGDFYTNLVQTLLNPGSYSRVSTTAAPGFGGAVSNWWR